MANRRRKGIQRVTLTLPEDMLARIEAEAAARGIDRLALIRLLLETGLQSLESVMQKKDQSRWN